MNIVKYLLNRLDPNGCLAPPLSREGVKLELIEKRDSNGFNGFDIAYNCDYDTIMNFFYKYYKI